MLADHTWYRSPSGHTVCRPRSVSCPRVKSVVHRRPGSPASGESAVRDARRLPARLVTGGAARRRHDAAHGYYHNSAQRTDRFQPALNAEAVPRPTLFPHSSAPGVLYHALNSGISWNLLHGSSIHGRDEEAGASPLGKEGRDSYPPSQLMRGGG